VLLGSALLLVVACGEATVEPARSAPQPPTVVSVPEPSPEPVDVVEEDGKGQEAPADSAAPRLASYAGWFKGELMTDEMVPAVTRLRWKGGALIGEYSFGYELDERGTLRDCSEPEPGIVRCEWRDEYGTGALKLSFTSDTSSFDGEWSQDSEPELSHPWTGVRMDEAEQGSDDAESAGD